MAFGLLGAALAPGLAEPGSALGLWDFSVAGWVALLLLLLRRVYDITFTPWLARRLLARPADGTILGAEAVEPACDVAPSPAGPVARTWDSASERDEEEKAEDVPTAVPAGGARLRRMVPRGDEVMAASSPGGKPATAAATSSTPAPAAASVDTETAEAVHKRAAATADSMWIAALNLALVLGAW